MKAIVLQVEHEFGDEVYMKTDPEQQKMIVTGYIVRPDNSVRYLCTIVHQESQHFGFELASERDIMMSTTN